MINVGVSHPSFGRQLQWIDDFVPEGSDFSFKKVTPPIADEVSWHNRGAVTTKQEWKNHFHYALKLMRGDFDVVIVNFPQMAFAACFWKIALLKRTKIICWSFNIGSVSNQLKGLITSALVRFADAIVVHSRDEIKRYSSWLSMHEDRFIFVPLQHGVVECDALPSLDGDFVISMGSAGRDYATLFEAVRDQNFCVIVIAKPEALEGLDIPANVVVRNGLTLKECQSIAANAKVGVVPISNVDTASGQVTFLMLMALGVPIVVTDCPGTRDYISDGHDALVVPPRDVHALRKAIGTILNDDELQRHLSGNAKESWRKKFSDQAAGRNLLEVLRSVSGTA